MGLIGTILGSPAATNAIGTAVTSVAEVFTPNATKKMEADAAAWQAALDEHGAEFQYVRPGLFDRFVNGLNRLPRPMLALGTLGLFVYAMIDPAGFSTRMVGLNAVPEPLWWLLGAIVGFYFGAREFHYNRIRSAPAPTSAPASAPPEDNPALTEFLSKGAAGAAPAA
ncbi:methionine synthase I [Rhodobacter capsulatus]|uniref:Methionine synthase I n=1 Tax=Rhodobacter capsulatus TaxID=1061 RepID=A0A4U1JPP3_RHOCA|nr:holin family protein [Rhodobacter capsulatus]TKD15582.1 methionine synthase I [Rhodobacter capsulatus]